MLLVKSRRSRDVALTTLIDLFVQIVFVFSLLLVASRAIEGTPEERGFVAPDSEEWKTLVNILELPPGNVIQQVVEGAKRIRARADRMDEENRALRKSLAERDREIQELQRKQGGAPGYPPCRASDGSEIAVLAVHIDLSGNIVASALPAAGELGLRISQSVMGRPLSRQEFMREFSDWRARGLQQDPRCRYVARITFDPKATAGDFQPTSHSVQTYFRLPSSSPPRPGN